MAQSREDLPLARELPGHGFRQPRPSHELDGDDLLEHPVRPLGAEDAAHAALAEEPCDAIGTEALRRRLVLERRAQRHLRGQ